MPNNTPEIPLDRRYAVLVGHLLTLLDINTKVTAEYGPDQYGQGERRTLEQLLHLAQGLEKTDLDGLRARFAKGA